LRARMERLDKRSPRVTWTRVTRRWRCRYRNTGATGGQPAAILVRGATAGHLPTQRAITCRFLRDCANSTLQHPAQCPCSSVSFGARESPVEGVCSRLLRAAARTGTGGRSPIPARRARGEPALGCVNICAAWGAMAAAEVSRPRDAAGCHPSSASVVSASCYTGPRKKPPPHRCDLKLGATGGRR